MKSIFKLGNMEQAGDGEESEITVNHCDMRVGVQTLNKQ